MYAFREKIIELQRQGKKIHRLDIGEVEPKKEEWMVDVIKKMVAEGVRYGSSKGAKNLIDEICKLHGVEPQNVAIGPGSKFILYALIKIIGKDVCTIEPAWPAYRYIAKDLGFEYFPIKAKLADMWQPDIQKLAEVSDKTVVLNTPSNPTSVSIHKLDEITELLSSKNNFQILDLAYGELSFKPVKYPSFSDNRIVLYTMSKLHGLSGWRVGYALLPKSVKEKYDDFVSITINNVPEVAQELAAYALQKPDEHLVPRYERMAAYTYSKFNEGDYRCVMPDSGIYLFVELKNDGKEVALKLLDHGFAVMPGIVFGEGYEKFIRITMPEDKKIVDELFEKVNLLDKK